MTVEYREMNTNELAAQLITLDASTDQYADIKEQLIGLTLAYGRSYAFDSAEDVVDNTMGWADELRRVYAYDAAHDFLSSLQVVQATSICCGKVEC